ncbi:MAG: hypothetical protein RLZZ336_177 [Cyanobacteriota bacterium]|jgi:hypothetical protein
MSVLDCLQPVHRSPGRLRYRIRSSSAICWTQLQRRLDELLSGLPLYWRVTPGARSVLLVYRPPHDSLSDGPDSAETNLRQASQRLITALGECGATPAAAEVIQIRTRRHSPVPWHALGHGLINGLSAGLSLVLVGLACLLILLGALGLMVPLAPGGMVLVLAYGLVELALRLRQPFVNA